MGERQDYRGTETEPLVVGFPAFSPVRFFGSIEKAGGEKDKFIVACRAKYPFNRNPDVISNFGNQVPLPGSGFF